MSWLNLYEYQENAISRMHNGCILCGGVGSGKSRTALAYFYKLSGGNIFSKNFQKLSSPAKDLYIITTARKRDLFEWDPELAVFLMGRYPEDNACGNKVVVDSWNNIGKYSDIQDAFFIFDEQRVVGKGAWVKSFLKIAKHNQWILLSATPGDTWSDYIPVFIANGYYKNRTEFNREHVIFSHRTQYPQIDRYINTGRLIKMRNHILVTMDYKKDTTTHDINVRCVYDIQKYKDLGKKRWNPYSNEPIRNAGELCYLWRKVVNSDISRVQELINICNWHPRVIVFYNFDYELDILKKIMYGENVEVAEWNGHMHQPLPESDSWVYLVQYSAGCEGWNCIKTDTIVFFSQNYSYKVMTQAKGRIDRLNTPYSELYYYHFRSSAPIDLAIKKALSEKRSFNESAFVSKLG